MISKYNKMSIPAKAALWFTICGIIQKGISFITVPIFTRLLTTTQYGQVSVYNSWFGLLSIFCTLNLFLGGFNNGMLDYEEKRTQYVAAVQGLITTISVFFLILYLLAHDFWNRLFEIKSGLIVVMFIEILMTSGLSLWSSRERYEFKYKNLVGITIINAVFPSFCSVMAISLIDKNYGADAKIVTNAIVTSIICGCIYVLNFKEGKTFFHKDIWKSAFLFNLPLLPHYLSTMILNQADRIMISKMVGDSEAGIYSVAYSAAMVLNVVVSAVNNSFAPWIYERLKEKDYKLIGKTANLLFIGVAALLVMLIALAPETIRILAGSKYEGAVMVIPSVASSLYFIFMYQIFANIEFYFKKNKFIAYASVIGAMLNVLLNYIGIKWFGYIVAGYTTLICYIIFGIAHFYFMNKICKEFLQGVILFDSKTIFITAFLLVCFAVSITFLYGYVLVRYAILVAVCIVVACNRNKISVSILTFRNM